MAQDRQFLVEALDAQGNLVASVMVSGPNVVGSRITSAAAGAAASLVTWAGNGQSATVGAAAIPPSVRVLDASGLPVAGSTVTFQLGTGTSASASGMTQTTNANGVATIGGWSVGTTAGQANTLFARSGNLTNSPLGFAVTPVAGSAYSVAVSAGNSQTSTPASQLASRLTALVHDQYGNVVNGATVNWSSSDPDAAFSAAAGTTNASGLAGVVYTTGNLVSLSTATVYAAISSATSARFGIGMVPGTPLSPRIVSGDGQTALSGATLTSPIVVEVTDQYANPITSGQTLQFVVVAGSGNLSSATSTPNSDGTAEVSWAMGATAGINYLEVSLEGVSNSTTTVTASGTNPLADTIAIESGNAQSGTVDAALSLPLAVLVTGGGSASSGQAITFSADSGSLSTTLTKSSDTGIARTVWTLPKGAGAYSVTASADALTGSPLTFTGTATAGSATSLIVSTQPTSNPQPGVAFPQQPVIVSTDVFGNPVSTNTRVGAVLASGDGTLDSAVSTYAIASGATATFSGLSYTYVTSQNFQLEFEARSLSTATATAQVSQPPFATQLAFTTQPAGGLAGWNIGTVTVDIHDSVGNDVPTATNAVTLALTAANNTEGATLSGTLTRNASGGRATFTGLTVDTAGSYTLDATATGLTGATSASFPVSAPSNYAFDPVADGMTNVVNRQFNTKASASNDRGSGSFPDKVGGSEGWDGVEVNYQNLSIVADTTGPLSPGNVMRVRYPVTQTGNKAPATFQQQPWSGAIHGNKHYTKFYSRVGLRLSSTYYVGSQNNKLWFMRMTTGGEPFLLLTGSSLRLGVNFQGTPDNDRDFGGGANGRYVSSTNLTRDVWYTIETYGALSSGVGVADGVWKVWVNGALAINLTDIDYLTTAPRYWDYLHCSPTYGGTGSPPAEFSFDLDHVSCWGRP